MAIKIFIVEDIILAINNLETLLKKFVEIEILGSSTNADDAIAKINFYKPDLVFLDIQLGKGSGFEVLDCCRGSYKFVCFTTAHVQHAFLAFNYPTIHYLLKPVTESGIKAILQKYVNYAGTEITGKNNIFTAPAPKSTQHDIQNTGKYFFSENKLWKSIEIKQIIYINAANSSSVIRTINSTFKISKNLMHMNLVVNDYPQFMRVHRSYIINTQYVREINKSKNYVIMTDGTKIPVSLNEKAGLYSILGL